MSKEVAFIGLGNMGSAIATNLLDHDYKLFVYNRTPEKAAALIQRGASLLQKPSDAFLSSSIVITMLANDSALEDVVYGENGIEKTMKAGSIHLSLSTVSPELSAKLTASHSEKGGVFLAAPVFGRPDVAKLGKLWIAVAGEKTSKEKVAPVLSVIGQKVYDFGEDAKSANIVKLCGNFLLLSSIEALSEAQALAKKNGLDSAAMLSMFTDTFFACPAFQTYSKLITSQKFKPAGFALNLGLKDIRLVKKVADLSATPMPFASLIHDRMLSSIAKGRQDLDWSALSLISLEDAGLTT